EGPSSPCCCPFPRRRSTPQRRPREAPRLLPAGSQRALVACPQMSAHQLASLATSVTPHLYWITSRAAGTAALVLSSLSVSGGVSIGGRLPRGRGPDLRVAHEALSLATLAALLLHGLALVGDGFLHPSLFELAVPFVGHYRVCGRASGSSPSGRCCSSASP